MKTIFSDSKINFFLKLLVDQGVRNLEEKFVQIEEIPMETL